jgi:predicted RNase H-like HicB family nuclease
MYKIILEPQAEGGFTVFVPELPDVVTEGDTREEALGRAKDAIEGYLHTLGEMNWQLPRVEEANVEVSV